MEMKCATGREKIMSCSRSLALDCGHDLDFIIECINTDYDKPMEPEPGTVKMVNP